MLFDQKILLIRNGLENKYGQNISQEKLALMHNISCEVMDGAETGSNELAIEVYKSIWNDLLRLAR